MPPCRPPTGSKLRNVQVLLTFSMCVNLQHFVTERGYYYYYYFTPPRDQILNDAAGCTQSTFLSRSRMRLKCNLVRNKVGCLELKRGKALLYITVAQRTFAFFVPCSAFLISRSSFYVLASRLPYLFSHRSFPVLRSRLASPVPRVSSLTAHFPFYVLASRLFSFPVLRSRPAFLDLSSRLLAPLRFGVALSLA